MKKKDILSIVASLEKINNSIERNLDAGIPVMTETLADCQDAAIAVGNEIEKQGKAGEETVHLLEAYCENIYQMNCQQEDAGKCRKIAKKIQKQLVQIHNHVKYDLPDERRQVVFLPYKASMWDSLESVWKAADADPDCDVYVIPIPYYDKNPDGSFREIHYEGGEYPSYVPITDYETYDFEKRHPDVIFIHNPYDEFNHVTSVPPFFYSKNLKKHTDMLVYIPYFILSEVEPDDREKVKEMEHFCVIPAVVHADRTVVQSDKMRRIYIDVLTENMGKETRDIWEKKILGLGSPKIDKVLHTKKEDLEIPEEWRGIIEKPDGSWKKIIFYNTSVSALLKDSEKMLRKMEWVFERFKKNQEEAALLWRPHPLIKATIESMRPQLWIEYKKIVEQYRAEGWGIYDDTSDMDRAISISDAYYGDGSSLIRLFQETGKPVMKQDVEILEPKRYEYDIASAEAICSYRGDYYFVYMEAPVLCRMSRETLACELLYRFQEGTLSSRLYRKIVPYQNRLFLIPFLSDRIAVYDIGSGDMQFIQLHEEYVDVRWQEDLVSSKFEDALVQGKFLYMIPYSYHALLKLDMESLVLEAIPLGKRGKEKFVYCMGAACMQGNRIVFPIRGEGSICVFNTDTNEIDRGYPSGVQKKYSSVFLIEDHLWLIPDKLYEGIDVWDIDSRTIKRTVMLSEEINLMSRKNEKMDVRLGFILDDKLHLLSWGLDCSMIIDPDSGAAELWNLPYEYRKETFLPEELYRYYLRYNSIIFEEEDLVICGLHGEWTVCNHDGVRMVERQSVRSGDVALALAARNPRDVISESRLDLDDYIILKTGTGTISAARKDDNGKIIYEYISGQGG